MQLPTFPYHPDPLATGSVMPSTAACACCGHVRGYVYTASLYGNLAVETLCPWCIADGTVAARLGVSFNDRAPLAAAGLPAAIIDEVTYRTPGYSSWQQEVWQVHCGDAGAYRGDASRAVVQGLTEAAQAHVLATSRLTRATWEQLRQTYAPGGAVAIYHFQCRHCDAILLSVDAL